MPYNGGDYEPVQEQPSYKYCDDGKVIFKNPEILSQRNHPANQVAEPRNMVEQPPITADLYCVCGAVWEWKNRSWELEQQPVGEPVAWICEGMSSDEKHSIDYWQDEIDNIPIGTMLYTRPQPAAWVGLTDEEIDELARTMVKGNKSVNWLAQAIEAKLKEKNT